MEESIRKALLGIKQTNKPPSQEQRTPAASQLRVLKTEREVSITNLQVEPPPQLPDSCGVGLLVLPWPLTLTSRVQ